MKSWGDVELSEQVDMGLVQIRGHATAMFPEPPPLGKTLDLYLSVDGGLEDLRNMMFLGSMIAAGDPGMWFTFLFTTHSRNFRLIAVPMFQVSDMVTSVALDVVEHVEVPGGAMYDPEFPYEYLGEATHMEARIIEHLDVALAEMVE